MQLVEQVGPFSICSGRLGEMLMMQCADPNTLPAPSRLHQLGQSMSLSLSPSASFKNPYPSFHFSLWSFEKRGLASYASFPYCSPFSAPPCATRPRSTSVQCLLAGLIFPQLPSVPLSGKKKCPVSERYGIELARNQMHSLVVPERWRHKGWWNCSPVVDRGENCAENVSQIE